MKYSKFFLSIFLTQVIAACGGGDSGNTSMPTPAPSSYSYTISGIVAGLATGKEIVLLNNLGNTTTVKNNGSFIFSTPISPNGSYAIKIGTQPNGQICTVSNGTGFSVVTNISNVSVNCSDTVYTVSGTVSGLGIGKKVTLLNNSSNETIISNNGFFSFSTPIAFNGGYAISVGTQPNDQICTVSNGLGAGTVANINDILINCSSITYPIGGTISGLGIGKQVTLLNNAGSPTIFKSNGTFNLNTNVAQNGSYAVTIGAQPNGQTCSVNNGTGSNVTFGINNINVFCTATVVPVLTKIGSTGSYAQGIAIQSDGKMVVTGVSSSDVAVVRYNANGSLDTSFGTAGIVTTNIFRRVRSTDWATGVAIQSDGKILVVGSTIKDGDPAQGLTLIRYNTDGSLDSSFADSGIAITMHPMKDTMGTSLAIQSDGKIVVAGIVTCVGRSTPGYCTLLQRFTKDGAADLTFNGPGLNRAEKTTKGARGVVLSNDGKILVVGSIDNGNAEELSVARYMPDGLIDTSFGNNGVTSVAIGNDVGSYNYGKSIVLQADGKILVSGGAHTNSSNNHFSLTRLLSNGRIDVNFGRFGSVVTNVAIPPESDHSHSLAVQPDGKILIAGEATVSRTDTFPFPGFVSLANVNFALVRYNINGSLDTTFGTNGIVTTDVNQLDNRAYAMAIQPNGFIVLVGESFTYEPTNNNGGFTSFGIVRYRPDGTIDTNFGPGY